MSTTKGGAILRSDCRDREAHVRFGQVATSDLPTESNFGFDLYRVVEPEDAISCTAFSVTKIRASQTKIQYDVDELWKNVPKAQGGADPKDTIETAKKNGLKDFNDPNIDFGIKGYYRSDTGFLSDAFDNTRSAMQKGQSSTMNNTYWYQEWNDTNIFGKMPIGKTAVSAHSYVIVDWKVIDGETVFLIDSHQGQKRYMPRETFNQALAKMGTSNLLPCDQEVLDARTRTVLQWISDLLKNVWIGVVPAIQVAINNLSHPPVPPQPPTGLPPAQPAPVNNDYQEVKTAVQEFPRYQWDTIEHIRKSLRIICDEEGLILKDKDMTCDICSCESQFNPNAIGRVDPRDRGLFQWNSHYHPEITDEIAFNPEKNARLGAQAVKAGKAHTYWSASEFCWNKNHKYF